jgi:hypothetical protein
MVEELYLCPSLFLGSRVNLGSSARLSPDFWFIFVYFSSGLEGRKALTPCSSLGLLHQTNLRLLLSHNIFSIDQIQQMRKLWVARVRSNTGWSLRFGSWPRLVKNKRNEKAAKFSVPLPKVRGIAEEEMFKVVKTGKKTAKKGISDLPFERLVRPRECPSIALECLQTVTWRNNRPFGGCVAGQAAKHNNWRIFRVEAYDHQAHVRRTGFYQTACQIREIHSAHGTSV